MKIKQTIKKIEEEIEEKDNELQKYWKPSTPEHTRRFNSIKILKAKLSGYKLGLKDVLSEIDDLELKYNNKWKKLPKDKKPIDAVELYMKKWKELKKPIQEVLK